MGPLQALIVAIGILGGHAVAGVVPREEYERFTLNVTDWHPTGLTGGPGPKTYGSPVTIDNVPKTWPGFNQRCRGAAAGRAPYSEYEPCEHIPGGVAKDPNIAWVAARVLTADGETRLALEYIFRADETEGGGIGVMWNISAYQNLALWANKGPEEVLVVDEKTYHLKKLGKSFSGQ